MADAIERVFALHDFDAENPDEVSFKAGETIVIVEKDDAYGDGWWQGTNPRGETGLFPFSYTTYDRRQATSSSAAFRHVEQDADASHASNGKGVKATIDDIDQALAGMSTGEAATPGDRRSVASGRSGDLSAGETDEADDADDEYEKRAKARAALAVNAARNHEAADEAERAEQARLKAQAVRIFQEEEEKHRRMLLQKEEERKVQAAQGILPADDTKDKEAPIPGVDMSDESDSEGSERGQDFEDAPPQTTHAPLLGEATPGTDRQNAAGNKSYGVADLPAASSQPTTGDYPVAAEENNADRASSNPTSSAAGIAAGGALAAGAAAAASQAKSSGTQQDQAEPQVTAKPSNRALRETPVSLEDRSSDSIQAPGKTATVTTAPTSVAGNETPKSQLVAAQQSPQPSISAPRVAAPGGDPHEWSVDQVVEWARSKGWDEGAIVSKFAEHEISGDVLMEMDINILKEIDILAFGKRFQVANGIKELKKAGQPADTSAVNSERNSLNGVSPQVGTQQGLNDHGNDGFGNGTVLGVGAGAAGLGVGAMAMQGRSPPTHPFDQSDAGIGAQRSGGALSSSFGAYDDTRTDSASQQARGQPSLRTSSGGAEYTALEHDSFEDARQSISSQKARTSDGGLQYSNFNSQHASPVPKKRESGCSGPRSPADRSSFFAGLGQRNRKPAPRVQSGATTASEEGVGGLSRNTFSRLGLSRLKHSSADSATNQQDLRNKISLPTDSPRFDAMGDTARRSRMQSAGASRSEGMPGFGDDARRQDSTGDASMLDYGTSPNGSQMASGGNGGAVMARIRPVDREGWMRKRGERYNTWKARYMALKGSDLVLLRDPTAPKIKGYVNMRGYKVIADENTNPGKYGFKLLHESEKPHYFSSDDPIVVREWMKALMKATIGRDTSLPVISSYNNATISLKEAQGMNPPPRPPSPISRARAQRAAARQNKDQLTAKDANVLMSLGGSQQQQSLANDRSGM